MEDRNDDWWVDLGTAARDALGNASARRAEVEARRVKAKRERRQGRQRFSTWTRVACGTGRR